MITARLLFAEHSTTIEAMDTNSLDIFKRAWDGRAIMLLDLDAFFASVEQLDHPEWRGKPVIVGGKADKRGVVSTASYEARRFGVHSAMPSATAQRLCPQAIWATPRFERYRELSDKVMDIMYAQSPLLEKVSIDEAFLDITPGRYTNESPVSIAQRIQTEVAELGITCSIGLASGKTTAKIASDLDKPQGLSVVFPGSERQFLAPMDVRAMPGIGKSSAEKLVHKGMRTLGDIAGADVETLQGVFGTNAQSMRDRARGMDPREIVTQTQVKSVSHERTFVQDLTKLEQIEAAIDKLGVMVGRRLRSKGLAGHTVTLKLRYSDLSSRTAQQTIPKRVDDETIFIPMAKQLVPTIWRPGDAVRLVGVGISGFEQRDEQMGLFADDTLPAGNPELIHAADRVKDRFGEHALQFGRELKLGKLSREDAD